MTNDNFYRIIDALSELNNAFKSANLDNHIALQITPKAYSEIRSHGRAFDYISIEAHEDKIVGVPIVLKDNSSD